MFRVSKVFAKITNHNDSGLINILLFLTVCVLLLAIGLMIYLINYKKPYEDPLDPRINLIAARQALESPTEFPELLTTYKFDAESTGLYANWDKSELDLGSMCVIITQGLKYANAHENSQESKLAIRIAEDFMSRYKTKLGNSGANGIPWGNNWYEFSISSTFMAACYLLLPKKDKIQLAADLILALLQSPIKSLGYKRDGVNTVYMAGPYAIAKYYKGESQDVWDMPEYQYVLNYIKFDTQYKQGAEGLHFDNTFVFHTNLVTYAYLATLETDVTNYYYKLDTYITRTPASIWQNARKTLFHPTIGVSAMGVFGRNENLSIGTDAKSPLGIKVLPFARYIRYFTKDCQFSARTLVQWYGFFEADRYTNTQSQYWTQYRNVHTADSPTALAFPDAGFICRSSVKSLIQIPSTTSTTTVFTPKLAESFVLMYERYGVAWQTYKIEQFGPQTVTELIVIDSKDNTIDINVVIRDSPVSDPVVYYSVDTLVVLDQYRSKLKPLAVESNKQFVTHFDLYSKTVITKTQSITNSTMLPLTLNDGIVIDVDAKNSVAILRKNNKPTVICPKNQPVEARSITLTDIGTFKFDDSQNQYVVVA